MKKTVEIVVDGAEVVGMCIKARGGRLEGTLLEVRTGVPTGPLTQKLVFSSYRT